MGQGIDNAAIETLAVDFAGRLLRPGDQGYEHARRIWNVDRRSSPGAQARPTWWPRSASPATATCSSPCGEAATRSPATQSATTAS
jgi:hypothetical protein